MRRIFGIAAAALLVVGVGVAVAHSNNKSIGAVSAAFTAKTVSELRTSTCTSPDGDTYVKTRATYTGATTGGDWGMNTPVKIDASSLINTTDKVGVVEGKLRIEAADGKKVSARFTTVYSNGIVAGLTEGHASPDARLLGNFSATFDNSSTGGFDSGEVGGQTLPGDAVLITRGGCRPDEQKSKPERIEARGKITEIGSGPSSISVAGVTCTVPTDLQSTVGKLAVGDFVSIKCDVENGATTLTKVSGGGPGSKHDKHDNHGKKDKGE